MPAPVDRARGICQWSVRLRRLLITLILLLMGALFAPPLRAQVPTAPGDTIPRDTTLRVRIPPQAMESDTLPRDTLRTTLPDTLAPPPHLPRYPQPEQLGWAAARWQWDRPDLLRFHGLTLLELLERTPGLIVTRAGGPGMPAGTAAFGQGGGRLRVFRDGFELDPLNVSTLDLQQIGMLDLDQIRIERTLAETIVHLRTFQLPDRRPFSEVEVGTGNFQARFLRAMFTRPVFRQSVVTAAYDLTGAGGFRFREPSSVTSGRIRLDYPIGSASGIQLELNQVGVSRESPLFPGDFSRRELVLRGRTRLADGFTADAVLGRATHDPAIGEDPLTGALTALSAATDTLDVRASSTQAAARTIYQTRFGFAEAGMRFRAGADTGFTGPSRELTARGGLQPVPWLGVEGLLRSTRSSGEGASESQASLRTGAFLGLTAFASLSTGQRLVTQRDDFRRTEVDTILVDGVPTERSRQVLAPRFSAVVADVGGTRVGLEWTYGRSRLGSAMINLEPTTVIAFGTGFDRGMPLTAVGRAQGIESHGSLSLPGRLEGLVLEAVYNRWLELGDRPYLPVEQARVAAIFSGLFREGQLEPNARLELTHRGASLVPNAGRTGFVRVEPYTMLDFSLQLRILDVRAFFIYENILNELDAVQIPGRFLPPTRTLYGMRWFFRN
ncbi:hypothetical protein BH23GEM6_BH23GEM6_25230 [soil metagenome]